MKNTRRVEIDVSISHAVREDEDGALLLGPRPRSRDVLRHVEESEKRGGAARTRGGEPIPTPAASGRRSGKREKTCGRTRDRQVREYIYGVFFEAVKGRNALPSVAWLSRHVDTQRGGGVRECRGGREQ